MSSGDDNVYQGHATNPPCGRPGQPSRQRRRNRTARRRGRDGAGSPSGRGNISLNIFQTVVRPQ